MSLARKVLALTFYSLIALSLTFCAKGGSNATEGGTDLPAAGNGSNVPLAPSGAALSGTSARATVTERTIGSSTATYSTGVVQELFVSAATPVTGLQASQMPTHYLCTSACSNLIPTGSGLAVGASLIVDGIVLPAQSNGEIDFVVNSILINNSGAPFLGGSGGAVPPPAPVTPAPAPVLTGAALAGQTVFTNSCASCHGSEPDYTQYTKTSYINSVSGNSASMPKGGSRLSSTDVTNITAYFNAL